MATQNGGTNWSATPEHERGRIDLVLVGAGLANALIALSVAKARPHLAILMIERGDRVGGNHTWSFHTSDMSAREYALLKPMLTAHWPSQEVRFPGLHRVLQTGYNSITSDKVHDAVMTTPSITVELEQNVSTLEARRVTLADGSIIESQCIIDGRGAVPTDALMLGYQKFVGIELELEEPHGQERPIIMDATVDQIDGYRFVYTLPFSPTTVLAEDTYYSDTAHLDADALAARTLGYVAERGWKIKREIRREKGILPITLAGSIDGFWAEGDQTTARSGMRACLFHPTTGYSMPDAVKLATHIADAPTYETRAIDRLVRDISHRCWRERGFFRMLNRMLFIAAHDHERRGILERFYGLPASTIERFYAGELRASDKARILVGRPPLPIPRAMRALSESQAMAGGARRVAPALNG